MQFNLDDYIPSSTTLKFCLLYVLILLLIYIMNTEREEKELQKSTALCIKRCERLNKEAQIRVIEGHKMPNFYECKCK